MKFSFSQHQQLTPIILIFVLFSSVGIIYSSYRYMEIKYDTNALRVSPKVESAWGISQLYIEVLKFDNALYAVTSQNSAENRKNITFRLDILYSRIDVVEEVFDRLDRWLIENKSSEFYPLAEATQKEVKLTVLKLREQFSDLEVAVQKFLRTLDTDDLPDIHAQVDQLGDLSTGLAAQANQLGSQTVFNMRESLVKRTNQFQLVLLISIIIFMLFSVVVLFLLVNARRAERNASRLVEELRIANQTKSQFLSSMSHELRTPLNAILGFGQVLESNPNDPLSNTQQEYVKYILNAGEHLLELINEVLDLSMLESGKLSISLVEVNLNEAFKESISLVEAQAKQNSLHIINNLVGSINIKADITRFRQVLLNLLSNAVKYNREGGTVTLNAHYTSQNDRVRIAVVDTGDGIPDAYSSKLFEPYERLSKEMSNIEGAGIGLAITKKLVNAMGGDIGYESQIGVGSTFWVEFPAVVNAARKSA